MDSVFLQHLSLFLFPSSFKLAPLCFSQFMSSLLLLQERVFLTISNYIFTAIFVAEMTVKVKCLSLFLSFLYVLTFSSLLLSLHFSPSFLPFSPLFCISSSLFFSSYPSLTLCLISFPLLLDLCSRHLSSPYLYCLLFPSYFSCTQFFSPLFFFYPHMSSHVLLAHVQPFL